MNKSRAGWDGGRSLLGAELPQQAAADSDVYTEEEELSDEELDDDFSDDDERREEESIIATIYHRVKALGFHRLFLVRHAPRVRRTRRGCHPVFNDSYLLGAVCCDLWVWLSFARLSSLGLELSGSGSSEFGG